MKLKKILALEKNSIVSIVGAGGKTSLMFAIAEELRKEAKVLVTTTTKIFIPEVDQFDYSFEANSEIIKNRGIYIYGDFKKVDGKICSYSSENLNRYTHLFDYVLIESDGSKKKALKAWSETEPVIIDKTTKTIAVLSLELISTEINSNNIYRLDRFLKLTNSKENDLLEIEHLISVIFHKNGLFKNSRGERILFINKIESKADFKLVNLLLNRISDKNKGYIDKIVYGSLKNGEYYD